MSYFLRGGDGFRGLGATAPTYENCGITDSACVARNDAAEQAYLKQLYAELGISDLVDPGGVVSPRDPVTGAVLFPDSGDVQPAFGTPMGTPVYYASTSGTATPAATAGTVNPATPSGGNVAFSTSRGSNAIQVGDTWLVSITGASPNAPVTATVGASTTPMGQTDASGNFSLAGTARTQDVGTWNESWAVGGVPSGAFSFTVSAPPSATTPASTLPAGSGASTTPAPTPSAGSGTSTGSAAGASSSSTVIGGFDLSSVPTWGWLAAAGVAAFFMFGKGGR